MKKILSALVVMILVLAGCTSSTKDVSACDSNPQTIGLVTDTGGVNDKSFNQGTWEGVEEFCKESGEGAGLIQSKDSSEYESNLSIMSNTSKVVVAPGFNFEQPIYNVAKANPDTNYILIDGTPKDANGKEVILDNVHSFIFKEQEAGYLSGYIAGKTTKTNHIGFIGGEAIPPVQKFGYGYILGAQDANPDVEVEYSYANTFADAVKGKSIADTFVAKGVDIIFTSAGGTNSGGVVESVVAATEAGKDIKVIGVDRDMYEDGLYTDKAGEQKSVILTSAIKNVGQAAKTGLAENFNNSFKSGITVLGAKEDGVGVPEINPNITDDNLVKEAHEQLAKHGDVPDKVDETKKRIKNKS